MGDSTESAWWIGGGSHPFAFSLTYEIHVNIGISGHSRYKSVAQRKQVPEGHITWEILLGFLASPRDSHSANLPHWTLQIHIIVWL